MDTRVNPQRMSLGKTLLATVTSLMLLIGGWEGIAYGLDYYVAPPPAGSDVNPGTQTSPWATIQKAANIMVAGDNVYIRAGTYQEQVTAINSGTAGNPIVYTAYPNEQVTIDGSTISLPTWETGLFHIEDRQYITVSGLRIINAGPNDNNCGIYVDNSSYIIIRQNYIYNTVSSGIGVWNSSHITIDENEIELCCNDGEQECVTVAGTDTFEVKNNHIHHGGPGTNGGEGICLKDGSSNGKAYKNHIHHVVSGERTGIYVDAWDKHTFNIEVYQNTIHDCAAGISLASESGGLLEYVKIYNNITYSNMSNGLEIGDWGESGIVTRPIENVTFINNTVYNNGLGGWGGGMFNENPDVKNLVVRNNIFSQNASFQIADEAGLSAANLIVDHNLIHGYRGYTGELRGTDYVEADPKFMNPTGANFHLQISSPAIDKGSPVGAPNIDFGETPRPQKTGYDIGAYEVVEFPSYLLWTNE